MEELMELTMKQISIANHRGHVEAIPRNNVVKARQGKYDIKDQL